MLLTGNHNYKKTTFDLIVKPIIIQDGAWIGAKAIVCPGVEIASHGVLTAGSVAINNIDPYTIYQGNPAVKIRTRVIE
jgi:putative colanic acid biosynthesis acetyltransferase WcaF